jgi:hypothetical protein
MQGQFSGVSGGSFCNDCPAGFSANLIDP